VLVYYCVVIEGLCWCLVCPAFLYLNVHVLKVFYEQIYYYYYYYYLLIVIIIIIIIDYHILIKHVANHMSASCFLRGIRECENQILGGSRKLYISVRKVIEL